MLSDGATLRQAAHQAHVSLQTALLWKRKMQRIPENAGNTVLSGEVWVDHAYINAPMLVRKGKKRRGLAGTGDSEDAFLGHIASGSCVYHDMGHFGSCFPRCREKAVNSEDPAAHCLLNPVNLLCAQVKRMFAVHLRIHRKNVPLWLNEKAFQREKMGSMGSSTSSAAKARDTVPTEGRSARRHRTYSEKTSAPAHACARPGPMSRNSNACGARSISPLSSVSATTGTLPIRSPRARTGRW